MAFLLVENRVDLGQRREWVHGKDLTVNRGIRFVEANKELEGTFGVMEI